MLSYKQYLLQEAAPSPEIKSKQFYHGSMLTPAQMKDIMTNGLDPNATEIKYADQQKSLSKPVANRVYVTSNVTTAIVYALKGYLLDSPNELKRIIDTGKNSYLFTIPGELLKDVYGDEDTIGEYICGVMSGEINDPLASRIASKHLTEPQLRAAKSRHPEYTWFIKIGKRLMNKLPDELHHKIILRHHNVSHEGNIIPQSVVQIDLERLYNDATNKVRNNYDLKFIEDYGIKIK